MSNNKSWLQKGADFITYNLWEINSVFVAALYAVSGTFFCFPDAKWLWIDNKYVGIILLVVAIILSVVGCIKLCSKKKQYDSYESTINEQAKKIQLLEATMEKYGEENYLLFQSLIASISSELSFNGTDRISIYKKEKEQLVIMSRYSINPDYNKVNRRSFPISEGYIGRAMSDGTFFIDNLPPSNGENYYSAIAQGCNISKGTVRSLSMKSRTYYCKALTDLSGTSREAVIVFESTKKNRFTDAQIDTVLVPREKILVTFIERLRFKVPDTDFANTNGF